MLAGVSSDSKDTVCLLPAVPDQKIGLLLSHPVDARHAARPCWQQYIDTVVRGTSATQT